MNPELRSCGDNEKGQLGYSTDHLYSSSLRQIETEAIFKTITTCADFNVGIDMDGSVWGWGDNSSGVFSSVTVENSVSKPTKIFSQDSFGGKPLQIACTKSACLVLCQDDDDQVWVSAKTFDENLRFFVVTHFEVNSVVMGNRSLRRGSN